MRPTVSAKHKELQDKIAADVEAFLANGGKASEHRSDERARPPVDHWEERVSSDYKAYQQANGAKR